MVRSVPPLFPPTPIVAGLQQTRSNSILRPNGTTDWLFVLTLRGSAWYRRDERTFESEAGDLTVIRQGAPHDYGCVYWENIWIHVHPRASWLNWLQWPEVAPGIMNLRLPPGLREQIERDFRELEAVQHGQAVFREELAMNILERAILRCESINPRHGQLLKCDPRITKAADWLSQNFRAAPPMGQLAELCGLSRSRFAELFRIQTGQTVTEFIEKQRLERALHLLRFTAVSVTEIAEQLGYSSLFYFSLRFKRAFGWSPRAYRKRQQPPDADAPC